MGNREILGGRKDCQPLKFTHYSSIQAPVVIYDFSNIFKARIYRKFKDHSNRE
jgi:hypothetical protein